MTCYAIGHLRQVEMGSGIIAYVEGIDATLAPFQRRFIILGGEKQMLEGQFQGDLIVIAFPDRQCAEAWYHSPAYQALLPRRTEHSEGEVFLLEGVDADHKATDVLR
ncbi:DUF1330 domain-containing protein [Leisingera thetidis]|uniref:DUF1330 domain-containing protein n=1 Tax=Leisingera thetidis TaxID=2930199 RepID=UPI0021F7A880|nr:DUF1330 domain-containing protein [Leisingera thetidis]